MSKSDNQRERLKAADRRRARRPSGGAGEIGSSVACGDEDSSSANRIDVTGLCIAEILRMNGKQTFRDSDVVTAVRSCLAGGTPQSPAAQTLCRRFEAINKREEVSERRYREALQGLVRNALKYRAPDDDFVFMRFLSVLAN